MLSVAIVIRPSICPSVRPSVRPSYAGIVSKGSYTIMQWLRSSLKEPRVISLFMVKLTANFQREHTERGRRKRRW